jgi:hypothetical protein
MSRSLKFIAALAAASPFWRRSMVGKFGSAGKLPKARRDREFHRLSKRRRAAHRRAGEWARAENRVHARQVELGGQLTYEF